MSLDELRELIANSDASEWHQISRGALYNNVFTTEGSKDERRVVAADQHDARLVYREDVALAIEWGLRANDRDEEFHPWADDARFPDPRITTYVVDVFYHGSMVDRGYVVAVDGGRAYLPAPQRMPLDGNARSIENEWGWGVTLAEFHLARIVHGDRYIEFDDYFKRTGVFIEVQFAESI